MGRIWIIVLVFAWIAPLAACDRNTEAFVEGEKPRSPDLGRIFPESDSSAKRPGLVPPVPGAPQRGAAPLQPQALFPPTAPVRQSTPESAEPTGGGDTISGTISVAPELQGSVPAQGLLFVIARATGVRAGPPMAVLRIPNPSFPLQFEIGPQNVMIPSMRFQGDIDITVRVDGDGNAMTKLPGDLSGQTAKPETPGSTGVRIVLDHKL